MKIGRHTTIMLSTVLYFFLVNISLSLAQSEYVVFGPKQYDKPKGSPVTYTDTLQGYEGISYTLWVQSGQDGLNEVKNVSVSINGAEALDSSDLRKSNPSTKKISLQSNNALKIVLKGKGGNFITIKVLAQPLNISIISPLNGQTVSKSEVTVKGTIINLIGNETGVTVNGKLADIYGNQFIGNNISLVEGVNTITVTAKDTANNTATASITLNAITTGSHMKLSSNLDSSIAPFDVTFSTATSKFSPSLYQMDFEGDGVIDYTGPTFENIKYIYTTEGVFSPTVTANDSQGNTYSDSIAITVLSKSEIDALLKNKWERMKEALRQSNIESALNYFTYDSRQKYRTSFIRLQDKIQTIVSNMQNIELIYIKDDIAKYRIRREQVIDSQASTITYYIYFAKNRDGIWQIEQF